MYSRIEEVKKTKNIDVLFLGSSHTYRGFDPRIFKAKGMTSFNLGSSAQTPLQTKVLLNRYLDHLNPKLIIYEVYPTTFSIDGVESSLDLIANDKNDINTVELAFKLNNIKAYNTLIFGLISDFLNLNSSFVEPKVRGKDTYISGGFVENREKITTEKKYAQKKWDFNENQFKAFNEIISMLKARNIKVALVYAPIAPALYHSYSNNQDFDIIMNKYGNYYNFNEIISLKDNQHFVDSDHLNQGGVDIFNDKLIEILNNRQALPTNTISYR
jgi:hypothetical protein